MLEIQALEASQRQLTFPLKANLNHIVLPRGAEALMHATNSRLAATRVTMRGLMSQTNATLYIGKAAAGHLKSLCKPFLSLGEIAVTRTVSFG